MSQPEQNFQNHAKFVPVYHYYTAALLLALMIWAVIRLIQNFSIDTVMMLVLVVALFLIGLVARAFPLGAQDRIIRLEERLRMAEILPEDLKPHINEISTPDLIALRFASDEELPDLVRRTVAGEFKQPKAIKQAIRNWRADHHRI